MTEDVKKMCGKVEAYKTCSDKLHQALLFMLVESPEISKDLVTHFKTEPNYRYAGKYLKTYEAIANKGRDKTKYESLEPAISTLSLLDAERESRVRKQLDNLKPLTKFIGEDYWEYARLRRGKKHPTSRGSCGVYCSSPAFSKISYFSVLGWPGSL